MLKSIHVATTLGVVLLSVGPALAADPALDPPGVPTDSVPPPPADPGQYPAPTTTTTTTTPVNPVPTTAPAYPGATATTAAPATTEVLPPAGSTAVSPPAPPPPMPVAGHYPDQEGNPYVERGFGKGYPASVMGAGILIGGGVQDFSRSNIRGMTDTGGFWSARLIAGTREFLGLEAAYIGSAQSINALGLSNDAVLVSNGVEGALRINIPIVSRGGGLVEPFAFGGVGWSRYHIARSTTNTSDLANNDDLLAIPYGAGIAFASHGFMADARFTYRSTFYNDLLQSSGGALDNWSAGAQLGFEF
jgi:hypothetical protein